jgi:DNA replication protein DnaC
MAESRHLRLLSTHIVERVEENLNAMDWLACSECGQEYRPFVLKDGKCDLCRAEAERVSSTLKAVFNGQGALVEMSQKRFIETADNGLAYNAAKGFDSLNENLYLFGQERGTGKTMLATKIIRNAIINKQSCAFVIVEQWLRSLYGLMGLEQQAAIDRLVAVRVLVLDEVGFEPRTDFSARGLYDVINSRMLKPRNGMVITSNLDLDALATRLQDDRISSRIGGMCRVIEITGKDWRQPE